MSRKPAEIFENKVGGPEEIFSLSFAKSRTISLKCIKLVIKAI